MLAIFVILVVRLMNLKRKLRLTVYFLDASHSKNAQIHSDASGGMGFLWPGMQSFDEM
jgi:hypothetical protein